MSLLFTYMSPEKVLMACDDHVQGRNAAETFPKFQLAQTVSGRPLLLGASGLLAPIQHTFKILPKMLRETGIEIAELQDFFPGCFAKILAQRPAAMVDRKRDVIAPPIQTILAGFDADAGRVRAWLTLANGVGSGVVHELKEHDFAAIGFLTSSDDARLLKFNAKIKQAAPQLSAEETARLMASEMKAVASAHRGEIGQPKFFCALDGRGARIEFPPDLPLPPSVAARSESAATHAAAVQ
jgi:hypothetical protein